jgi:hypothetical protein
MAGKPTKDTPQARTLIARALELGLGIGSAASLANVARDTVYDWRKKDPDFDDACRLAVAKGKLAVASKLMALVQRGNLGAIIFWLKTRTEEFREVRDPIPTDDDQEAPDLEFL